MSPRERFSHPYKGWFVLLDPTSVEEKNETPFIRV